MRRIANIAVILLLMTFMVTAFSGCVEDIDWKASAKKVAIEWIKDRVVVAIDKYGGEKEAAVKWVVDNINDIDKLQPVTRWMPMEELAGAAWDYIWANIYEVARDNGMDVDADEPDPYAWHVTGGDFDGVDSTLLVLLE